MRLMHCSLVLITFVAQASFATPTTNPDELKSPRPGIIEGYLPTGTWVDSLALLPPPPAVGSAAQAADDAVFRASRKLKDSPRWLQAEKDAELAFPKAAQSFQCALGIAITPQTTPHLNMLLHRTLTDAAWATFKAKDTYSRQRPLMAANENICTPNEEASLRKNGSYPSGHAALGWAWGLVLTEVAPERANDLMQRAKALGQSRVVCGVHWQSDVDAGRLVGSAVFAQLHANAEFNDQLALARKEVAAARAASAAPTSDCVAEAKALAN